MHYSEHNTYIYLWTWKTNSDRKRVNNCYQTHTQKYASSVQCLLHFWLQFVACCLLFCLLKAGDGGQKSASCRSVKVVKFTDKKAFIRCHSAKVTKCSRSNWICDFYPVSIVAGVKKCPLGISIIGLCSFYSGSLPLVSFKGKDNNLSFNLN